MGWEVLSSVFVRAAVKAHSLQADVIAYSSAINACKKGAAWEEALELLREMMLGQVAPLNCLGGIKKSSSLI